MKKILFFAICFFSIEAMASDVNVAGKWLVKTYGPFGRTMEASFVQKNKKITVHAVDAMGSRDGEGVIQGNKITWFVKVNTPNGNGKITFTGDVAGDSMQGTATFIGNVKVNWSGKRI
jgi:hypothetical protein